jgi:hypothetical protein
MVEISNTPSADLPRRFTQAKKAAIDGKIGKVTVLGVSLVDVEMIERGEKRSKDMNYTSLLTLLSWLSVVKGLESIKQGVSMDIV